MKRYLLLVSIIFVFFISNSMADDLDDFIMGLNIQVKNDEVSFKSDLSMTFGVQQSKVETVIKNVDRPADAYMIFRLSQITNKPSEEVLTVYKKNKKNGWGNIAKELGIKPGSKEFHELKENKLAKYDNKKDKNHERKEKGKGKGKDRD
ncbi:MAG: hypothetical protein LDL13_08455 [Calditerrivibrio sp.]|nr:hypothetical protein [Calditerrivibrio sp.]MCA1980868.1 hypothetical protein [Calditerrivibrio sp.]